MRVGRLTPSLALLLAASFSRRRPASAFVPRAMLRRPAARGGKNDGGGTSSQTRPDAPSLRARGGGGTGGAAASGTQLSSTTAGSGDDGDDKARKIADRALRSMRACCKMCVAAVAADVVITLVDEDMWSKFFGPGASLNWVNYVDLFDSVSLLVFAGSLWRLTRLFWKSFCRWDEKMGGDDLLDLFRTMAWMWGVVAANHCFLAVSMAAALPKHGGGGVFQFAFDKVSSSDLSLVVVGVLGFGSVAVRGVCDRTARAEVRAYEERRGTGPRETMASPKLYTLRQAAFGAYCNQALCAGSFAVMTSLELAKWVVTIEGDVVGHFFSVWDFLTPLAITSLLLRLNRALVRAAIAEMIGDGSDGDIYQDLFVAQAGFYDKVAETLKAAAIMSLLPYAAAPAIPYVLKAARWVSPSLVAKATEAFGVSI